MGLLLAANSLHNFVDGLVIMSAFNTSTALGIATWIAVLVHELPHEAADVSSYLTALPILRAAPLLYSGNDRIMRCGA